MVMKKILLLGSLFSVIIAQASETQDQKVSEFISALKQGASEEQNGALYFPWGGHLRECRDAVSQLVKKNYSIEAIKHVIKICNGTGSDGQKWVQTVFWPRARLMLQVNFFNDFLVHIGEDKVGMNLLMTFLEFAQKHQDLFLKYVANFQFSQ